MTHLTDEQKQEAKNDLLLADMEMRFEQIRQMKTYEGPRLIIQAVAATAAVFAAGALIGGLFVRLMSGH